MPTYFLNIDIQQGEITTRKHEYMLSELMTPRAKYSSDILAVFVLETNDGFVEDMDLVEYIYGISCMKDEDIIVEAINAITNYERKEEEN